MRTISVKAVWHSHHFIEVPDDFENTGSLEDFSDEALEQNHFRRGRTGGLDPYGRLLR